MLTGGAATDSKYEGVCYSFIFFSIFLEIE